jgi:hypothetical protein
MNTVTVGLDNGSLDYLGRREPVKKQGNDPLAKAIASKWSRMKTIRQKSEALRWEACAYVQHRMNEFSDNNNPIKPVKLYNTAGILAFDTFINGYHGNLITPSMRWFKLTLIGENYEDSDTIHGANDYLEISENQIYAELNKTNFYPMDKLATKDAAVQGTSAEWVYDDVEDGLCVFETIAPWDFWIDKNHRGKVDTIFIRFTMTASDALDRFKDRTPKDIVREVETDAGHTEHEFVLAIYPRKKLRSDRGKVLISTEKPYAAVTYYPTDDCIVEESGYDEFPVAVHVFEPDGTSVYGKGLVMKYITELKRLNSMSRDELEAIQKVAKPPMAVPESLKGRFSSDPGARNYVGNSEQKPEIIQTVQDIGWVSNEIKELEEKIGRLFFNDLFNYLMRQDKVLTATQTQAIKSEELALLASILGTTQYMKINPIVKRVFRIMAKGNRLPKPPKEMLRVKNALMKIELDGPLAKNVKMFAMQDGLQASLEWLQALHAMQMTTAFDNLDTDVFVRKALTAAGLPQSALRELADVAKMRQQKAQMIQEQQQMQQMQQISEMQRNVNGQGNLNNAAGMN